MSIKIQDFQKIQTLHAKYIMYENVLKQYNEVAEGGYGDNITITIKNDDEKIVKQFCSDDAEICNKCLDTILEGYKRLRDNAENEFNELTS